MVRDGLELNGSEVLLDAFAGVGTFAILLAPHVKKVLAIEESSAAVADARENAAGIDNLEFLVGRTEDVLRSLDPPPDAVVLDPPRAGCHPLALERLAQLGPRRVAYVSCDVETLARDLKILCDGPFSLVGVTPLDMFPTNASPGGGSIPDPGQRRAWRITRDSGPMSDRSGGNGGNLTEGKLLDPATLEQHTRQSNLVLASASPRRAELMAGMGLDFRVSPAGINEDPLPGEPAEELVQRLAWAKAWSVAKGIDPRAGGRRG